MAKKLKIAFFAETYFPLLNGVTSSVDSFAKALREKGHIVYIFAPRVDDYVSDDPFFIQLPSVKAMTKAPQFRLPTPIPDESYRKINEIDFDIVHAHGYGGFALLGYQAAHKKKIPFVLTFHTLLTSYTHYFLNGKVVTPKMLAFFLKFLANLCDGIISPSGKMMNKLTQFGVTKPITVIPNILNPDAYSTKKSTYLHKKIGLTSEDIVLLSVGRLGKEKNFAFLLRMFRHIYISRENVHLVIVGDGVEEANLKKLAKDYKIASRVHIIGRISAEEMPQVYSSADIFVFSSVSEVHPMVILEAAASGLPFVVADDESVDNLVVDNLNGYRLPLKQKLFSQAVVRLLDDEALRKQFGLHSREIVSKNFVKDTIVKHLESYYEALVHTPSLLSSEGRDSSKSRVTQKLRLKLKNLDLLLQGKL